MLPASVHEKLREILEATPGVELAALFGSHARGTASPDSDLDLALRLHPDDPREHDRLVTEIERAVGREVDVVVMDAAPPLLRFEIARDGAMLVERRPYAWADFRARAMIDWWDFAPYAEMFASAAIERLKREVGRGPA
jgi:predicted nucleotidyltransferase